MYFITKNDFIHVNTTPSRGNQGKFHVNDDWIKTDHLGYEGASEYLCSKLLENSNIPSFVSYRPDIIDIENAKGIHRRQIGCISKDFKPKGAELVSLDKLLLQHGLSFLEMTHGLSVREAISKTVDTVQEITGIQNYGQYLTAMLEFDALVLNEDRHTQNICFLYQDGKYTPSPVFDNGASFLSDTSLYYPLEENTKKMIPTVESKPFSTSFETQVTACQELFGKQLEIQEIDISPIIFNIKNLYGEKIADRIDYIYHYQMIKNKELIQIVGPNKENFLSSSDMQSEILAYVKEGGTIVHKQVTGKYEKEIEDSLQEEEISYVKLVEDDLYDFIVRDFDTKAFLKIQERVFKDLEPPPIPAEIQEMTEDETSKMLEDR